MPPPRGVAWKRYDPVNLRRLSGEAVRYLQSGLGVYALDLATYSALFWIAPAHYVVWTVAGRLVGAAAGFVLHNTYSFRGEKALPARSIAVRYAALWLANAALSVMLLRGAVEGAGLDGTWARPAIDVLVIGLAFVASKYWVFRKADAP